LTGLWQVSGKNRTTFTRMIQLDIEYARTKNLRLDLKIILKTVPALLLQLRDTRLQGKAVSRSAASEAPMPLRVANR
jgi:lipopolysaccharide/colanic/teichoic acid biosynthesis glycosyltransferase